MNPLTEILRDRIRRAGHVPFEQFMATALYHPEHGYYRRDRFGRGGDFFTAEQIQPVFGTLMAQRIEQLRRELGEPDTFSVVELGPGRCEMAESLRAFNYIPVEAGGQFPSSVVGVVFSNEFFDALPVHRIIFKDDEPYEALVGWADDRFRWMDGPPVSEQVRAYLDRYLPDRTGINSIEVCLDAIEWLQRIAASLVRGFHLAIDYGYTSRELVRFPEGTLLSYRRHRVLEDVLASPGEQDITAHVCFSTLVDRGEELGLRKLKLESLAATLLDAGRGDEFARALSGGPACKLQLKTLLFGMGEQFRTLLQRKEEPAAK